MTQPHPADSIAPVLSDSEPLFKQGQIKQPEIISDSENLILLNRSTLQENEVIRVELSAEMPLIHRQTVVRENLPISQHLAKQPTD